MLRIEIHPGEGGADAATFARELADAVAKHSKQPVTNGAGTALVVDCL